MVPDRHELERLYAYPESDRPWLRTNFVSTLDGAAYAADGRSGSLGGPVDTMVFALLRSLADVIVVGAGTARSEKYAPVLPTEVDTALRERLGLSPVPPIAVVSRRLVIPERLLTPGQLVITMNDAPVAAREALGGAVEVIARGDGRIDWQAVMSGFADRGWHRILCEGGPSLHGELVELDLVDELCLTIAPVLTAGPASRIAHGPVATDRAMTLEHMFDADGVQITRWMRNRSQ